MKTKLKSAIAQAISNTAGISPEEVIGYIEKPKNSEHGDLAYPCFQLAKTLKRSPVECAAQICSSIQLPAGIEEVVPLGPFLNFRFSRREFTDSVLRTVLSGLQNHAASEHAVQTVVLEYSSPNIAKSFHVGHLRATLIGNSLDRIFRFLGSNVVSINHLGDWGTQFGFVWAGCEMWGKPQDPSVHELVELYRRATSLKQTQEDGENSEEPNVNDIARAFFLDLESSKPYALEFWQWCLDISMKYLKETYTRLGVHFEHYIGESFYSDKLDAVRAELAAAGVLKESQQAFGVDLGEELGFARVFAPDGRSLYLTRDVASAEYRASTFSFDSAVYVVGAPQTLHFQQLKGILKALGKSYADDIHHVAFGHVLGMKTRGEGGAIELNEFLDEAHERALAAYHEQVTRKPEGLDEKLVAEKVALGAILFSNLSRSRIKDVHFSWDHALEFQGDTGPYLLYACARINGVKEKALSSGLELPSAPDSALLTEDSAYALVNALAEFRDAISTAASEYEPAVLANYALSVAKAFSKAYSELKVVGEEKAVAEARLALFEAARVVLSQCLELLGMDVLERM